MNLIELLLRYRLERRIEMFEREREEQRQRQQRRMEKQQKEQEEYLRKQKVIGSRKKLTVKLEVMTWPLFETSYSWPAELCDWFLIVFPVKVCYR